MRWPSPGTCDARVQRLEPAKAVVVWGCAGHRERKEAGKTRPLRPYRKHKYTCQVELEKKAHNREHTKQSSRSTRS